MNCALAILMAYRRKLVTGEGARIDASMYDNIFGMLELYVLADTIRENHTDGQAIPTDTWYHQAMFTDAGTDGSR